MRHNKTLLMLVALSVTGVATTPLAASQPTREDTEHAVSGFIALTPEEIHNIFGLSGVLNSVPSAPASFGTSSTPHCGANGECNYVECPQPECKPGQSVECECTANGMCGPFWARIPTYDCKCGCYGDPSDPPPTGTCVDVVVKKVCIYEEGMQLVGDVNDLVQEPPAVCQSRYALPDGGVILSLCDNAT